MAALRRGVYHKTKEESKDTSASEPLNRKEKPGSSIHPTLTEMFQAKNPYPRNSTRWKTLTDVVCLFIAKDIHPYQTVNDLGFQHMLHDPPDRKALATKFLSCMIMRGSVLVLH